MEEGQPQNIGENTPYFTISELSKAIKVTVEGAFEFVRVRAEISRPTRAASGHLYFTLKDDRSTLAAVCWKTVAGQLAVQPKEGLEVIASGRLTTYAGQSKYQIIVSQMEVAGEGALLKQLEERRRQLAAEGLFDADRKQPIPGMPATIGVVTSPSGAVIRDILHRLSDRFGVRVLVWGTLVQGQSAAPQVAAAIRGFDSMPADGPLPRPDVLIVARGGGALEDLWAFNEEEVVRAVAACQIPVISAIGHETDTTLIDFAADLRAPTPTAAAEMAVPVKSELLALMAELDARLARAVANKIENAGQFLNMAKRALVDPAEFIARRAEMLDYAVSGLANGLEQWLAARSLRLSHTAGRLHPPERQLAEAKAGLSELSLRLTKSMALDLERRQQATDNVGRLLDANSFKRVLDRGFALVTDLHGVPVKRSAEAPKHAHTVIRFADGQRHAQLDSKDKIPQDKTPQDAAVKPRKKPKSASPPDQKQDDLF